MGSLDSELKMAKLVLFVADQLKAGLGTVEEARDASYATATQAQKDKALQDLTKL